MSTSRLVPARVVRGHQVASGLNGDPRFPGGTIRMQRPHFATLGLDLGALHPATLNVSLAPLSWQARQPAHTFRALRWRDPFPGPMRPTPTSLRASRWAPCSANSLPTSA